MSLHNEIGKEGEQIAANYLVSQGFEIIDRNYVYLKREIDIIAKKDEVLHVVEVKTSDFWMHEEPHLSVGKTKQRNLGIAAEAYLEEKDLENELQFDIIEVRLSPQVEVNYIPEAFIPKT